MPVPDPLHLLRRATYGPTPESEAELRSLGVTAWLDRQLRPETIDDSACSAVVSRFTLLPLDTAAVRAKLKSNSYDVMKEVGHAAIARAIWSRRQLLEVMVDFWSNHLNVTCPSGGVWDSRHVYDRTIRVNALGRFADLLKASAISPAMLTYLDNRSSTRLKPNENYARELLELHTVGLVHTEADVAAAARLLTGLTVDKATGLYRYDATKHAVGAVTVLGWSHANTTAAGGEAAVFALLDHLALHPATAERIARRLCVRFVSDDPPASLVSALATVYLNSRSAIAPVLRALFGSAEFAAAVGLKIRTPLEDIVATVRVLGLGPEATGVEGIKALYWTAEKAGQAPLRWDSPDGYPDVAAAWASPSGYLVRWNAHLNLAAGWYPRQLTRPASLLRSLVPGTLPTTYGALIDALGRRLTGAALRVEQVDALAAFFGRLPSSALKPTDAAVVGKLPHLVALILDAPNFQVR
jgi:uncharacterized protein (DUF1800 family)